jgi:tetratricopeptide (TPR) repeat protein
VSSRLSKTLIASAAAGLLTLAAAGLAPRAQQKPAAKAPSPAPHPAEARRLNNLAAAYMGQQRFADAERLFARALLLDPRLDTSRLNRGIALFYMQQFAPAREALLAFARQHPENPRGWYNLGLLYKAQGENREALDAFTRAAQLAPADADALYFLGVVEAQLLHDSQAIAAFQRALQLNPFHASAEFGLARAYQHLGQADEARAHLDRFQQLTQSKRGSPISLAYGDQGALSLVEQVSAEPPSPSPPVRVRFTPVPLPVGPPALPPLAAREPLGRSACWLDYDRDGLPDIFLTAGSRSGRPALLHNRGHGLFDDVTSALGLAHLASGIACAAADYDNDGFVDLAVSFGDRIALFHNEHSARFKEVTSTAAIVPRAAGARGLTWVDYDHDGDVDLFVAGSNLLWRNNGNGTFTDVTESLGIAAQSSLAAAATDLNNDRAVDLLLTGSTSVLTNPREGKWSASQPWAAPMPPTRTVAVLDFDKDGWMDLAFTHDSAPGLSLWRNVNGQSFAPVKLPDLHWARAWAVVALDYDNDGWLDLAAIGESSAGTPELRLLRNEGPRGFRDVTAEVGLAQVPLTDPRAIAAADFEAEGATGLLLTSASAAPLLLRNVGGNQNHFLRIALRGLNDNKSALGTKVEVFAGDLYQKWEIGNGGGPSQSDVDLLVGLRKQRQADVVRLLWPTGVVQDEVQIAAAARREIQELDRRGSSCPLLFAWDGSRHRMVADMLGAAVVGHWVGPGARNVPDSTEYLKVEGFTPQPREGRLSFRLLEPMEEVVYLDQVRLLAVDHPAGSQVFPNESFLSNPPYPDFKVIASHAAQPVQAWDSAGRDVSELLRAPHHRYLADFSLLPFKGFTMPHRLELDLGAPYDGGSLRLLMHGYIEYFTATSMYAAWQAGLEPLAPSLEAQDASGRWVRILDDMGFPAGLPRTITVDLSGRIPRGAHRLRISTNLQIYWDQVLVDRTPPDTVSVRVSEVPLRNATLAFHGYPRALEGKSPGDLDYVYEQVSRTGPYAREIGAYTRFGEVRSLLTRVDDRFVVFGSGEEVALEFDPVGLPSLQRGWQRDFFFFADGYEKDMDFYAADPLTVDPLPFHSMGVYPPSSAFPVDAARARYLLEFNSRFVSSPAPLSYRFHYPTRHPGPAPPR